MKLYDVTDYYVNYLRSDAKLKNVFSNKEENRTHPRKYLGVVFKKNGFNYFIPLASPKDSDYIIKNGKRIGIRKSIIPIIRITVLNKDNQLELKGTLKTSNMIPVPDSELIAYDIAQEKDLFYKDLLYNEYNFIRKNSKTIRRNAEILYNQKINENVYYEDEHDKPGYIKNAVDFKYAEKKCMGFCKEHGYPVPSVKQDSIDDRIKIAKGQ